MKCPKCGKEGTLKHQSMYQYALETRVLKNGKLSSEKPKRVDIGPEDWSCIYCDNCGSFWGREDTERGCGFAWNFTVLHIPSGKENHEEFTKGDGAIRVEV